MLIIARELLERLQSILIWAKKLALIMLSTKVHPHRPVILARSTKGNLHGASVTEFVLLSTRKFPGPF